MEYPKQIFCIWGANKSSLSATCELQEPKAEGIVSPLELHEGNLSRYVLTLLDTSTGATIPLIANIPAKDIPILVKKSDIALQAKMNYSPLENNTEDSTNTLSAIFTAEIKFGPLKGKTPAGALLENHENKDELIKVLNLLKDNVGKYPANQKTIDAIEEAIFLFDTGDLKAPSNSSTVSKPNKSMVIYDRKYKATRKKNPKGLVLCYNINITCNFEMNYPWTVTIENYYAPTINGSVDYKKIESKKTALIRIRDDDWAFIMSQFENLKNMFEQMWFRTLYSRSLELTKKQIEAAAAAKRNMTN